jgi:hypothetical protein
MFIKLPRKIYSGQQPNTGKDNGDDDDDDDDDTQI